MGGVLTRGRSRELERRARVRAEEASQMGARIGVGPIHVVAECEWGHGVVGDPLAVRQHERSGLVCMVGGREDAECRSGV